MLIRKSYIRNIIPYLEDIPSGHEFRPIVMLSPEQLDSLQDIGFSHPLETGQTILPNVLGSVSRYNADGKWEVHRSEKKEYRYIRTILWRWKQWNGPSQEEHMGFRDIYRYCYPRTLHEPPGVELTYAKHEGIPYISSPILKNSTDQHEVILHQINLILELFGECELVNDNLNTFSPIKINRVTWKMLPQGEHPWDRLKDHLHGCLKQLAENTQTLIYDRQETIRAFNPDSLFVGTGGFSDYIAYSFTSRNIIILECIRKGNALYVFDRNWKRFSQLTKAEIINRELHVERIIHNVTWKERLTRILKQSTAA